MDQDNALKTFTSTLSHLIGYTKNVFVMDYVAGLFSCLLESEGPIGRLRNGESTEPPGQCQGGQDQLPVSLRYPDSTLYI